MDLLINIACLATAAYFAMLWLNAERMYRYGVPFAAGALYCLLLQLPCPEWMKSGQEWGSLLAAVSMPILFEKEHRQQGFFAVAFAVATFAGSLLTARSIYALLVHTLHYQTPFLEIFLALGYVCWIVALQYMKRLYPAVEGQAHREPERLLKMIGLGLCWAAIMTMAAVTADRTLALAAAGCFAYFAGFLQLCKLLRADAEKEKRQQTMNDLNELRNLTYTIRSQRHDYNLHVHTIQGLLREQKYEACQDYVNELAQDTTVANMVLAIEDPAISAEIFAFLTMAEAQQIPFEIDIRNDMSAIATSPYETNKIIGNLLQNAFDEYESVKSSGSGISLSIFKRGEYCLISVSNPLHDVALTQSVKEGQTTKNAGHEGVGVASVKLLISKHGGVLYHNIEGNIITYTAKIPLRVA